MIPKPFISEIQIVVCSAFGLDPADMKNERKMRRVARPRQIAMFVARALTTRSFQEIGRAFGGRDHTTVIYAVRSIEKLVTSDPKVAQQVKFIVSGVAALVADRPHGAGVFA